LGFFLAREHARRHLRQCGKRRRARRYVGDQVQALAEWRIQRHLTWTAAYAHFFVGDFLKESSRDKDVDYASTWLTFKF